MLYFKDEMLIPNINGDVYFAIYEVENWLRRICLTVYMIEFGENWYNEIPTKEKNGIDKMLNKSKELMFLGSDLDKNPIWFATLGQLNILLKNEKVRERLSKLTNYSVERLTNKIDELREVRNLLAHNRALSGSTEIIVKGIIESFKLVINNFKYRIIYNDFNIFHYDTTDIIAQYFSSKMVENDWREFQAFIAGDEEFYTLVCLPSSEYGKYPSGVSLITTYNDVLDYILAFLINKECDEYSILISKKIPEYRMIEIIDVFLQKPNVWTNKKFEDQNPKYICNPKLWFYENRKPIDE